MLDQSEIQQAEVFFPRIENIFKNLLNPMGQSGKANLLKGNPKGPIWKLLLKGHQFAFDERMTWLQKSLREIQTKLQG